MRILKMPPWNKMQAVIDTGIETEHGTYVDTYPFDRTPPNGEN